MTLNGKSQEQPSSLFSQLRKAVRELEASMGVGELTECERDILCAVDWCGKDGMFDVTDVQEHPLFAKYSRPTIFRAIRNLLDLEKIQKVGGKRSGVYRLPS